VKYRKIKRVVGHVDKLDRDGVTGWALGPRNSPTVTLTVGGEPRDVPVERLERPDVAALYGPSALESGFFIDLKEIAPEDSAGLSEFLSQIEVWADGKSIKPSDRAQLPGGVRGGGLVARLRDLGGLFRHKNPYAVSDDEYERYFLEPSRLAQQHGGDLRVVRDATRNIRPNDILAFITVRNEKLRIPYFLDYYRGLGVRHFLFVDNDSTDGLIDYLKEQPDCSVWHTTASYKAANFGVHWMNCLLRRYGVGHWCLTLDPDEFLVFPYCEHRNLYELTEFLQSEAQDHFFCVLLDMYSDRRVSETVCEIGQNPLEIAPYFDGVGYVQRENASYGETCIQGGPRRRIFFRDHPEKAPVINKTPLVKWGKDYNYLSSTHVLAPKSANQPHKGAHLSPTGCLLHFKFLSVMAEKAAEEIQRKEHYEDSVEYKRYHAVITDARDELFYEKSVKYRDSRQLCDLGFMGCGRWF
jgi:hypothetical protein